MFVIQFMVREEKEGYNTDSWTVLTLTTEKWTLYGPYIYHWTM